jgi:poly(3-hydroxybutyrate) depolymerase
VYFVDKRDKEKLLTHILNDAGISRSLVFTSAQSAGADMLVKL